MKKKKITVKHYLNKKLKAENSGLPSKGHILHKEGESTEELQNKAARASTDKGPFYKVYTRVIYRQKTIQFRSRIPFNVLSEFEFNQVLESRPGSVYRSVYKWLERESDEIEKLIRLTNSDVNDRFDIVKLGSAYDEFKNCTISDLIMDEFESEFSVAFGKSEFAPLTYNINFEKSISTLISNMIGVCQNLSIKTSLDDYIFTFQERVDSCFDELKALFEEGHQNNLLDFVPNDNIINKHRVYPNNLFDFVQNKSNLRLLYSSDKKSAIILRKSLENFIGQLIDTLSGQRSYPRSKEVREIVDGAINNLLT